jgi:glycosyltransferase involved in cell wall biosynthesis
MSGRHAIVTLATAWGPKFGGINSFNTEIVKSLGILPTRDFDLICVVPGPVPRELIDECQRRYGVDLIPTGGNDTAAEVICLLGAMTQPERFLWIGHDDKTGPLALELKHLATGSRAVLINHMAHGAYQSIKQGQTRNAAEKQQAQLAMFRVSDLCFAVGPMLRSHLQDLLGSEAKPPPVEMLLPGLADPSEHGITIRDTHPDNYVAFVAGRLDNEDDRVKQGRLALRGFGNAVRRAEGESAIRRSPTLRMRGIPPAEEASVRDLLMAEARRAVNFDVQDFTEDREPYFRDLASASVAIMPSWHEGFGLTAWEAIACAVPVVISEESGVYRVLKEDFSGAGLGQSVIAIPIDGWLPAGDEEPNHTAADLKRVADALLLLAERPATAKQQALRLRRNLLALDLDWKGTVLTFIQSIEQHLGVVLTKEFQPGPPPAASAPEPLDLAVPAPLRIPAVRLWHRELGLPSSVLLAARDEVVGFDPERQPILDRMSEWIATETLLSGRLLFAPPGMGKTRLALELARRLQRAGWLVLWLPAIPPGNWLELWSAVLRTRGSKPVLLVIDYAEARPSAVLDALDKALEALQTTDAPSPIRLLLVARSGSWLDSLGRQLGSSPEAAAWISASSIEPIQLPRWSRDESTRLTSYRTALDDYAAAIGLTTPPTAYVPNLGDKVFDRPLYLHLAALAALEGQRPESAEALLSSQLQREWRYWRTVHSKQLANYDDWADALAYVGLRQGADWEALNHALEALGIDDSTVAGAIQRSYDVGDGRIAPLEPDLIAEALLRERLADRRGSALFDAAAGADPIVSVIAVVARLATYDRDRAAAWSEVLIAGVARHWPRHPNEWLAAAHGAEYGLGEILFAAWERLDESTRTSMALILLLPEYSTNLLQLTVAVSRQRVKVSATERSRAAALNNLAVALADQGDTESRAEASNCTFEALGIYRQLAAGDVAFLPDVAMALTNLANRLSEEGSADSHIAALAAAREAVRIYRHLTEDDWAFLPDLAMALNNESNRLANQGDPSSREEALASAHESVAIYRDLAEKQFPAYRAELATSLHTLSIRLSEQGDHDSRKESLECADEAVRHRRQLAAAQPAAYMRDLAASLTNFALRLAEDGSATSHDEALRAAEEAVQIYRKLADRQPDAYLPTLASMLINMSSAFGLHGDAASSKEALWFTCDAVAILRTLVEIRRAAHLPQLAVALINLSVRLSEQDDTKSRDAVASAAREATSIYRELVESQPLYLPDLAKSLHNLSIFLSGQGGEEFPGEAVAFAREAVQTRRRLAERQRAAYLPDLASSLVTLAKRLFELGDVESRAAALECIRESVRIFAQLNAEMPSVFERSLKIAIANLRHQAVENDLNPEDEIRTALQAGDTD